MDFNKKEAVPTPSEDQHAPSEDQYGDSLGSHVDGMSDGDNEQYAG